MQTILETVDLVKYYGDGDNQVKAIDHTSIRIDQGEFVAIVGRSGSGKSTLLHMLGGLDRPDSGEVVIRGENIFSLKDEQLAVFRRRRVGFRISCKKIFASFAPKRDIFSSNRCKTNETGQRRWSFMELLLVKRAQKGDKDAFVALIEKNKVSLYKAAKSYLRNEEDIADVMQDTILSAYEHIEELKNAAYFRTWITRILINECNSLLRRQKRFIPEEGIEEMAASAVADDREFYELLGELQEDVRMIFLLYYGEGFNIREIAQILDLNENTVKSRLQRGRKKLRQAVCY